MAHNIVRSQRVSHVYLGKKKKKKRLLQIEEEKINLEAK